MTKTQSTIAKNVKHYRKACKLSTQAAAKACGIRPNTWNDIERGLRDVRLSTLEAIAYTLNTSLIHLLINNPPNETY